MGYLPVKVKETDALIVDVIQSVPPDEHDGEAVVPLQAVAGEKMILLSSVLATGVDVGTNAVSAEG
jgi:hypothetical protein